MIHPWITLIVAVIYVLLLFVVASYGDRRLAGDQNKRSRPNIYAFSLAIYCTTWTFFGSVGLAATSGMLQTFWAQDTEKTSKLLLLRPSLL